MHFTTAALWHPSSLFPCQYCSTVAVPVELLQNFRIPVIITTICVLILHPWLQRHSLVSTTAHTHTQTLRQFQVCDPNSPPPHSIEHVCLTYAKLFVILINHLQPCHHQSTLSTRAIKLWIFHTFLYPISILFSLHVSKLPQAITL